MKLDDVLKLRPEAGADSSTIAEAIRAAEAKRRDELAKAKAARDARRDVLTVDDKALAAAERDGTAAALAAERIAQMLPRLQADLDAAEAREMRAALLAEHAEVERKLAELRRWQDEDYPAIQRLIGAGLAAQDAALTAVQSFLSGADAAYGSSEAMRDAGSLDVNLPDLAEPLPRTVFSGWSI